jgi:hypothetical protein
MRTDTRAKILKLIDQRRRIRPFDLRHLLHISAQALHRHLKALVREGVIEAKGSAPFTEYALAGTPDFEEASLWVNARTMPNSPESMVCETREVFSGRLPRLKLFTRNGLSENHLPLVISTAGEIGNNSFDHNLGQWRDVPGCWFEPQATGRFLWVFIADRGQGIFQSLAKVHPELDNEQNALHAAFETVISGRAPEQRGNGLKYVRSIVLGTSGSGLACLSGAGRVSYGERGEQCAAILGHRFAQVNGTVSLMVWELR